MKSIAQAAWFLAAALAAAAACAQTASNPPAPAPVYTPPANIPAVFRLACEKNLPPTRAEGLGLPGTLSYDYTRNTKALTAQRRGLPNQKVIRHGVTLGLTQWAFRFSVSSRPRIGQMKGNGIECARANVTVTVDAGPQTIYVGSEFPAGTCAFNEILGHEMRHAKLNQEIVQEAARTIEVRMARQYGQTIFYGPSQTLRDFLGVQAQKYWTGQAEQEVQRLTARHTQLIDTPEESRRMKFVCNGEVSRQLSPGSSVAQ